ncbi:MAG: hypothetical protein QOJ51_1992, partial [Acidobacteriaceae bacterium]|nr:hypothetical protein [Acidobacteriaceae bacterium]
EEWKIITAADCAPRSIATQGRSRAFAHSSERRFLPLDLLQKRPARAGRNQDFMRTGLPMTEAILGGSV